MSFSSTGAVVVSQTACGPVAGLLPVWVRTGRGAIGRPARRVEEVCVAGESPGREQQHGTSGEVAASKVADPRLVVFRAPVEVREAAVVDAAPVRTDDAPADAVQSADPESADLSAAEARSQSTAASTDSTG